MGCSSGLSQEDAIATVAKDVANVSATVTKNKVNAIAESTNANLTAQDAIVAVQAYLNLKPYIVHEGSLLWRMEHGTSQAGLFHCGNLGLGSWETSASYDGWWDVSATLMEFERSDLVSIIQRPIGFVTGMQLKWRVHDRTAGVFRVYAYNNQSYQSPC